MTQIDLSVALLHHPMYDKQGKVVTTSLTLIDIHDMARSARTYGARKLFICHPSDTMRKLGETLAGHWREGFGATYNPNRKDALDYVQIVPDVDSAIEALTADGGKPPKLIATSARPEGTRISFPDMRSKLEDGSPYLLLFGTGWGMTEALLSRADYFLEPVCGPGEYNHLSVRSACAIILDRLRGKL